MDLLEFKQALAKELTAVKGASRKRGRPSLESTIESPKSTKTGDKRPLSVIQFDAFDHFPGHDKNT
jgi:hypothetical protein